jgi:hypothetical protein
MSNPERGSWAFPIELFQTSLFLHGQTSAGRILYLIAASLLPVMIMKAASFLYSGLPACHQEAGAGPGRRLLRGEKDGRARSGQQLLLPGQPQLCHSAPAMKIVVLKVQCHESLDFSYFFSDTPSWAPDSLSPKCCLQYFGSFKSTETFSDSSVCQLSVVYSIVVNTVIKRTSYTFRV